MSEEKLNQVHESVIQLKSESFHVRKSLEKLSQNFEGVNSLPMRVDRMENTLRTHICSDARVDKLEPRVDVLEKNHITLSGGWIAVGIIGGVLAFFISTAIAVYGLFW